MTNLRDERPSHLQNPVDPGVAKARQLAIIWIIGVGVVLALVYWPLLAWLASTSVQVTQLSAGALLVVFATVICLQDALAAKRPQPNINAAGVVLLWLAIACLWLARHWRTAVLPLAVLSFCCALAAVVAFLFGESGVRLFLPALGGFFVFGLLIGLFPTLDWPLRAMAAKHAGSLLAWLHIPVKLLVEPGRPAELVLDVSGRHYQVATECNGFGLLTSAVLLATILGFQYRLPWQKKLGLVALSVPIAVVCNFLRIVSICLAVPRVPWSYHFIHETLGTLLYLGGLALVWQAAHRAKT